jgi:tetratricopeptide (TPR) repeat protein
VPIAAATKPISVDTKPISADTLPFAAVTAVIAGDTQSIGAATTHIALETAPISSVTATIAAAQTSAIEDRGDVPGLGKPEAVAIGQVLSTETIAEIERLRLATAAQPDDSDTLFELAVLLHRAGLRDDARESLTKLVTLYEQRGQHQQATRIKDMLGGPKTGPITTEELSTKSSDGKLSSRTAPLRNVTGLIGKLREESAQKNPANVHAFPPESMLFTIPLPDQNALDNEILEILRTSDEELIQGQYAAALDSCVQIIGLAPDYKPIYLRLAEIYTRQRLTRRARAQAEALARLADASGDREDLWMVYRVILHASGGDTGSLRRLVELLIDAGRTEQASIYASRLIQILDGEGLDQEALAYSIRLCDLIPGDTRAALENAILRLKNSDRGGALDRWESAVARGADPIVAKASIAALTTTINEDDHWRMLAEVVPVSRKNRDRTIVDAYARTAAMMPESATLLAGHGLLLTAIDDSEGHSLLAQAAGARNGAPFSRATAAVALAKALTHEGRVDEYVAAVRTALKMLQDDAVAGHPAWHGLLGYTPRFEDLSLELGDALLARDDAAGAAEVLKEGHARSRHHGPLCEKLADAHFKIGQLGSALTVLDELAVHYRSTGQLEEMAGVLRQMSQLAPNNIKVKSRLIDAYLQRGFVAEARAELIQRADLEERSGHIKDAMSSLQRAADLSWTIGLAEETFSLYSRVIQMAPDDVGNRTALVNFYLQMGRLSEAAEHQRAVVDIALRNEHRHEAIAALHQVIGLTPDDTTAYYQLADLLASMGEYRQAEKVYRRLVLMNPADPIAQAKATSMASLHQT